MKLRFKLIAIIILAMLILVCSYQVYWLINFHNEQYYKMEVSVMSAMKNADFIEIAIRIRDMHKEDSISKQGTNEISHDPETKMPDVVVRIEHNKIDGTIIWNDTKTMNASIQQGFHRVIDSLRSVDMAKYDSVLQCEMKESGIDIPYYLEYLNMDSDSIFTLSTNLVDKSKYREYIFPFSEDEKQGYHLYLEQPKWYIFKSMWPLVSASLLMIVLLIASYIYLLKTILRQKTLDEIKSDFINNMTHELKTPISITYAAVDALQNFGISDDVEKRDKYLTISKEQLMYLNSLVEQILTMSVEERKNLKLSLVEIDLIEVFENNKYQFLLNASKLIDFDMDITPKSMTINADRIHFGNVVANLIENAIKYSGDRMNIKLLAQRIGNQTIISVADNGIGIPQASLDKIFDKFYRVSTGNIHDVKGYGLGLFYVKTIVDKHGWSIRVESTVGKGTCFKIIIP